MNQIYMRSGISRQAHHQMVARIKEEEALVPYLIGLITEIRDIHPGMGLRRLYEKVEPEGIGRDRFIALGVAYGLEGKYSPPKTTMTAVHAASEYTNLLVGYEFTGVNQVWSSDITYYRLDERFYYITFIIDVYSRRIIGYALSDNLRAEHNIRALYMALESRGIEHYGGTLIHHSDRGSQYVSRDYTGHLKEHGIQISMCRSVYENTHVERVNRTIKNQYLKHWRIGSEYQLKRKLRDAVEAYNFDKPHSSLLDKSPVEYEKYLRSIPLEQRSKMQIFTYDNQKEFIDPRQMELFTIQ